MNSFGTHFRISIFGESHADLLGVCIDHCPAGIPIDSQDFDADLIRRKSGAKGTTPRHEEDTPNIATGVFQGFTTGAPITILFQNQNTRPKDYTQLIDTPRPGHADFTAQQKFGGFADYRGGGHFSGRLTLALVAAGVIAKKIIFPIQVQASICEVGGTTRIEEAIEQALAQHDSVGGIVECTAHNMPIGLGEPFFNSVESLISHLAFSIPAIKGIEFGSGFAAAAMYGSQHNDPFANAQGTTSSNHAGGINGGISNGNDLYFRVAVKPPSSIGRPQVTHNMKTDAQQILQVQGRHDACIALRVPVVLEAITAIALADFLLLTQQRLRVAK